MRRNSRKTGRSRRWLLCGLGIAASCNVLRPCVCVHVSLVEVEITATWTVRVPVSGMADEDAAMEYVSENYTSAECLSAAGDSWSTPDDTNMEVQRADLA